MNPLLLFLLLLKATITSFAGLASISVVQDGLVVQHHVLTNAQLNQAIAIGRSTPGPLGLYLVSAGYFVAGVPGAIAGWLAMVTPALLIVPLVHFAGRHMQHPRLRSAFDAVVLASAGLLLAATMPLAQEALTGPLTMGVAALSLVVLVATRLDTLYIILGASMVTLTSAAMALFFQAG